jgi:energy-coupling factor transport system ATP-binding protein
VVALLGANGSGKSTLLLALAGLLRPWAGTVDGARPGLVFQDPEHQLVAHTVAAEVGHGLGADRDEVVARLLERHHLAEHAGQSPWRLSGGEKRRLSLAAMLAHDRPALLLDEPTLGLDRRDTIATVSALRKAAAEGRAVLFASHDLRTVATLADRVVVLAGGRVVADGPAIEVLRDHGLLARAGLELPVLLARLLDEVASSAGVRRALRSLDDAVGAAAPARAGRS